MIIFILWIDRDDMERILQGRGYLEVEVGLRRGDFGEL